MLLELLDEVKALAEELRQCEIAEEVITEWKERHLEDVQDSDTKLGVMSSDLLKIIASAENRYEMLRQIENPSEEIKKEKLILEALSCIFGSLLKYEIPEARDFEDGLLTLRKDSIVVGGKRPRPIGGVLIIG